MTVPSAATPLGGALARLETRWGSAAVRLAGGGQAGLTVPAEGDRISAPADTAGLPSGLPELDALLGQRGLPPAAAMSLVGAGSSGKTTLALHWLASAQAQGAIAAYLDLGRAFDPLEAASRGVDLRWLLVLRPAEPDEGFAICGALLTGRAIELLIVDLPERLPARHDATLRRLIAHARRVSARLIVLEPVGLASRLHAALAEAVGLRLELEQRGWLRLGRDIVGRRVGVSVEKSRFGLLGRQADIDIRYLAEGDLQSAADRLAHVPGRATLAETARAAPSARAVAPGTAAPAA